MSKITFKTPGDRKAYTDLLINSIENFIEIFERVTAKSFKDTFPDLDTDFMNALDNDDVDLLYYVNDNLDLITANMETPLRSHANDWAQSSKWED